MNPIVGNMNSKILLFSLVIIFTFQVSAQNEDHDETTIYETWEETLLYGTETSVLSVIDEMIEQKDSHFADQVLLLLESNRQVLRMRVLDYFENLELDGAIESVLRELEFYQDIQSGFTVRLIQHLQRREHPIDTVLWQLLQEIMEEEGRDVKLVAIAYCGQSQWSEAAQYLSKLYEDDDSQVSVQEAILKALGKIRHSQSRKLIFELAQDDTIEKTLRIAALEAAGAYADEQAIAILSLAFSSQDPLIRSAAVSAFAFFLPNQVEDLYLEALRDNYWRIRLAALKGIEKNPFNDAFEPLRYMAMRDPESNIRRQAFRSLTSLKMPTAWEFMRESLANDSIPEAFRMIVVVLLIQENFTDSRLSIEKIMVEEWEKETSRLLDTICKELSVSDLPVAAEFYERMLGHTNFNIQIYGVRGIGRNKLLRYREDMQAIVDSKTAPAALKTNARNALEQF